MGIEENSFFSPIPTDKKTTEEALSGFFIVSPNVDGNNDGNDDDSNDNDDDDNGDNDDGNDETQRQ